MRFFELFFIAVGLAMDAFAVSISKGLALHEVHPKDAALVGAWFGFFQGMMPAIGYFLGTRFRAQIEAVDHWVAFGILAFIGINMLREALSEKEEKDDDSAPSLSPRAMLPLAVATSIDALAVGITFSLLRVRILPAVLFIGCITFAISFGGVYMGSAVGARYKKSATLIGGAILIFIGVKILLEHLGIL